MRTLAVAAVLLALVAAGAHALAQTHSSPGILHADSAQATLGDEISVNVELRDVSPPGLGAWTVTLRYDPAHLAIVRCITFYNGACNTTDDPNAVRASAAVQQGLSGDFRLLTVVFQCKDAASVSQLTPDLSVFGPAVVPPPFLPPAIESGSITCIGLQTAVPTSTPALALPSSGQGGVASTDYAWLAALVLLASAALGVAAVAARRRV